VGGPIVGGSGFAGGTVGEVMGGGQPLVLRQTANGYTFTFDSYGRTALVEGPFSLNPLQGRSVAQQLAAGGPYRLPADQGGHFIGRVFNGPLDDFNHFAQNGNFNQGVYNQLERSWQDLLASGSTGSIRVSVQYPGVSLRPSGLRVQTVFDGVPDRPVFFRNPPRGGR
jgi:hypothetical protein